MNLVREILLFGAARIWGLLLFGLLKLIIMAEAEAEAAALKKKTGDEGNGSSNEIIGKARIFFPSTHLPHGTTTVAMASPNHFILNFLSLLSLLSNAHFTLPAFWSGAGSSASIHAFFLHARPISNPIHQKPRPFNFWALSIIFLLSFLIIIDKVSIK
jgi:hypothetical protein